MKRLRILAVLFYFQLSSVVAWASLPAFSSPPEMTKLSIGIPEAVPQEDVRMAFNRDKQSLQNEYTEKFRELGHTDEDLIKRKHIVREYNHKLKTMRSNLRQGLGIKESKYLGPPEIYAAPPSNERNWNSRKLKAFQRSSRSSYPVRTRGRCH